MNIFHKELKKSMQNELMYNFFFGGIMYNFFICKSRYLLAQPLKLIIQDSYDFFKGMIDISQV
jgi:hypothetical protein